jgi:hypothetical protein
MKKKDFLTEAKRKAIIADKEKTIIESFAKTFNKIKRVYENEVSQSTNMGDKKRKIVVLVGPPSVGKSTWTENNFPNAYVINRDDIVEKVASEYGWTYDDMFATPPADAQVGEVDEKYGEVIAAPSWMTWAKTVFDKVLKANGEVQNIFNQRVSGAHPSGQDIIVDMTNMNPGARKGALKAIEGNENEYTTIAVDFKFAGAEEIIKKMAAKRAEAAQRMGKSKTIPPAAFDRMFQSYVEPSKEEGFDEIISVDNIANLKNALNEAPLTAQDKLDELVGKPISLIRTKHTRKYNPQIGDNEAVTEDEQINGVIGKIGDFEGIKGLTIMNGQGGKIAFLMYDKKSGEFIEGDSTWKYTYKGADEQSDRILKFILRYLIGANTINEFEELNPLYSRQQEYGINPEIDPSELSGLNTYKVEVIGKEDEKDGGSKHRWVYEIEANDEEEAEAKAADKFNEKWRLSDIYLFSVKAITNPTDDDKVQGMGVKISEELDNDDEAETIQLYPFSSNFIDIINGVAKTKNDLKNLAGATFGGASENFYNSLSIALNDFYKNIYKPIEAKYIEDMRQQDKARRRLYPQEYEK